MRAEERHELEKNTLNEELVKLATFLRAHGTQLALVLLLIAVTILSIVFFVKRGRSDRAAVINDFALVSWAGGGSGDEQLEKLQALASQSTVEPLAAEAMYRLGIGHTEMMLMADTPGKRQELASQAKGQFEQIIARFPENRLMQAKAKVALANVLASEGQTAQARERLAEVAAMNDLAGQPVLAMASNSLAMLEVLGDQPVRMASRPAVAPLDPNDIDIPLPEMGGIDPSLPGDANSAGPDANTAETPAAEPNAANP